MTKKTHTTAVVLIPPEQLWEPIQAIRQAHDRHVRRWMPHITLLYPFRPRDAFAGLAERFAEVCADVEPFCVELGEIRYFRHRGESFTLWLAPEPRETLVRLQAILASVVPDCDDVTRDRHGFTPHLSLAQARGTRQMLTLKETLQAAWQPITFTAQAISLIWRREPPDDVFRVGQMVKFASDAR